MITVTQQQAADLRGRGLLGFILDGDKPKALKAVGSDDTGLFIIVDANGDKIIASVMQAHPLNRREGYDELIHFNRAQYVDQTTAGQPQATALEITIRSNGEFEDPAEGANQRKMIEANVVAVKGKPGDGTTTVASVHPEAAAIIAEEMPQAEQDKAPKGNPPAVNHRITATAEATARDDRAASLPPDDVTQ